MRDTRADRKRLRLAAACAFLLCLLDVLMRVVSGNLVETAKAEVAPGMGLTVVSTMLPFAVVAAELFVLWAVGRQQRPVAPRSSRWGLWSLAAYGVAALLIVAVLPLMTDFAFAGAWTYRLPSIPQAAAFAFLGWASRAGDLAIQRWAGAGLLAVAALSAFHLLTGFHAPWLSYSGSALRMATWAVIGAWLATANAGPSLKR